MSSPDDWRALISATEKFADAVFAFAYKRLTRGRSSSSRARSYPRRRSRSTWRSRSRSADKRNRRGDKPHDETRPSNNSGAPTSGAPVTRGGATMQPMQIVKTGDSRVVTTGNTVPGSCSAPANSGGDQPASTPEKSGPPGTAVTTKVTIKEKCDQPTSSQLSGPKSFRIPKNTAKGGGTVTVEQIQEQIATDPKVGRKMGNCLIRLSKKAKNKKTSPAKPKKRGSFKRIWVSDSPDSEVEETANKASGSQSPVITAMIPADDIFSESE